jgi:hypothetical protein
MWRATPVGPSGFLAVWQMFSAFGIKAYNQSGKNYRISYAGCERKTLRKLLLFHGKLSTLTCLKIASLFGDMVNPQVNVVQ